MVLNVVLFKPLFEFCGALVVELVEVRLAPSLCQRVVYVGNGRRELGRRAILEWSHHDVVAIVVVGNNQVVVPLAGRLWQTTSLVCVDYMSWFGGGQEARVRACGVIWLLGEGIIVFQSCGITVLFGAFGVLLVSIEVPHGCGF